MPHRRRLKQEEMFDLTDCGCPGGEALEVDVCIGCGREFVVEEPGQVTCLRCERAFAVVSEDPDERPYIWDLEE